MESLFVGHGVPDRLQLARASDTLQDSLWVSYLLTQHQRILNPMTEQRKYRLCDLGLYR